MEYSSLRKQPTGRLQEAGRAVEALLSHRDLLPTELEIKLETFHADIDAILEDREDERGSRQ